MTLASSSFYAGVFFLCLRFISISLPFVSPSLARAGKILSPAGGVTPLEIVAELAALDGVKDHGKSVRAFDQARYCR